MTDCPNVDIRESLPELLHGGLEGDVRDRVLAHVDGCAACRGELAILQAVHATAPRVAVDARRIAAAIVPYRRRRWNATSLRLAAAVLIAAVGVSTFAVTHERGAHATNEAAAVAPAIPGLALVDVSELSDDRLAQLIATVDNLPVVPPIDSEPTSVLGAGGGV